MTEDENALVAILGDPTIGPLEGTNNDDLPNGQAKVLKSLYQLHVALDDLRGIDEKEGRVAALERQLDGLVEQVRLLEARPDVQTPPNILPLVPAKPGEIAERDMVERPSRMFNPANFAFADDQIDVHDRPQQFNAPVAFGGRPLNLGQMAQVLSGGEVLFYSEVKEANTQEKDGDRKRLGVVSFNPYDNGVGFIRGAIWDKQGNVNRVEDVVQMLKMDSQGTVSKSHDDYSKPKVERSQLWIIREDFERKMIWVTPCRAGWGAGVAASDQTTNNLNDENDGKPNFNRSAVLIEALPGAV